MHHQFQNTRFVDFIGKKPTNLGIIIIITISSETTRNQQEEEEVDVLGDGDLTPPIPVLQMNNDQINQYFPKLIKKMLDMEAGQGKRGRLWASSTEPAGKEKHTFLVHIDYICVISQERSACIMRLPR